MTIYKIKFHPRRNRNFYENHLPIMRPKKTAKDLIIRLISLGIIAFGLGGCAALSAVSAAGSLANLAMEASGIIKKENDPRKTTKKIKLNIYAGERLNTTQDGRPLSLVTKVYVLRSYEKLTTLTPEQLQTEDAEKQVLGEDLISTREITLIPGKPYEVPLVVPGDAVAIGVIGLFRAPYSNRWRLAFDIANAEPAEALTVGAHACALSASKGPLVAEINTESARSLVGVQCNS